MITEYILKSKHIEAIHYSDKKTILNSLFKMIDNVTDVELSDEGLYIQDELAELNDYIVRLDFGVLLVLKSKLFHSLFKEKFNFKEK